jgi:large subunit ribosomal protein L13
MEHTIDATAKSLGRVASEVAILLMGKHTPTYRAHTMPVDRVSVVHAAQMKITGNKNTQKTYTRYTGHPGGQRVLTLAQLAAKKGHGEVLYKAVRGMLPANKLRAKRLKNLCIKD